MSSMSESHWLYLFHKEVKSWDSTTWFRIWRFQTPGLKAVSSNLSPGWTVCFLGLMIGVFWKRESIPIKRHHCLLYNRQLFSVFTSVVYGYTIAATPNEATWRLKSTKTLTDRIGASWIANILPRPRGSDGRLPVVRLDVSRAPVTKRCTPEDQVHRARAAVVGWRGVGRPGAWYEVSTRIPDEVVVQQSPDHLLRSTWVHAWAD